MMRTLARTKAGRAVADAPDRLAPRGSKGPEEGRFGGYFTPSAGTPRIRWDSRWHPQRVERFQSSYKFKG